jgi:hypothetical protein
MRDIGGGMVRLKNRERVVARGEVLSEVEEILVGDLGKWC